MDLVNCARCGKLFPKGISPICPECEKEEELIFQNLREFLSENEDCTIGELSESTGVSAKKILGYIREGRLEISKGMHGEIHCVMCGRPITKGHYCDKCLIKLNQNISELFSDMDDKQKKGVKMHITKK